MKALIPLLLISAVPAWGADSTIHPGHRHAYAANLGWIDWRGDTNSGATIGEYVCAGSIYSANVGWIGLGSGSPADGVRYQNNSATDFGVNHDGFGNLRGFAYGANIGWIQFEAQGAPRVDLRTGVLSGSIYAANCGWISLSNAFAQVQTEVLLPGLLDDNGLPVAWEVEHFGDKNIDPDADPDLDGQTNTEEYLAGTDPNDPLSVLRIVHLQLQVDGAKSDVTWTSVANRCYRLSAADSLTPPAPVWLDTGLGLITPDGATTQRSVNNPAGPQRFFRVEAVRPLAP